MNGASGGPTDKPPVDRALEFLVYAPVGFTLMAWQAMPKLVNEVVSRGCAQLGEAETKMRQARMIGQVAVAFGPKLIRKEVDNRFSEVVRRAGDLVAQLSGGGATGPQPTSAAPASTPDTDTKPRVAPKPAPSTTPAPRAARAATTTGPAPARSRPGGGKPMATGPRLADTDTDTDADTPAPAAADLPIPAYDGLSASQVVSRLNGLIPAELAAVRAYESAGRARKTVLVAIDRLLP